MEDGLSSPTSSEGIVRLLDLFCGAGGAATGYSLAGFDEIVGVDIVPQPNYPFTFIQGDALQPPVDLSAFDLIHASPPCQRFTAMRTMANAGNHADLLTPTREKFRRLGLTYVIENVEGAPMPNAVRLCGSAFGLQSSDGYHLRRHRLFETSYPVLVPNCYHTPGPVVGFYGDHARDARRLPGEKDRRRKDIQGSEKMRLVAETMGIDWMTWEEAKEAIPLAYTRYLGEQFLDQFAKAS